MTGSSVSFFIQKKTKKRKKTTLWWAKKQNLWKIDPDLNLTGRSILQLISDLLSKAGAKIDILSLQKKRKGKRKTKQKRRKRPKYWMTVSNLLTPKGRSASEKSAELLRSEIWQRLIYWLWCSVTEFYSFNQIWPDLIFPSG